MPIFADLRLKIVALVAKLASCLALARSPDCFHRGENMRFYRATSFLFPRHYERRIMAICFGAVHLPLLSYIAWQSFHGGWDMWLLGLLLASTLAGTVAAIVAIAALLAPIHRATQLLRAVQTGGHVGMIPAGGDDLVGRLLQGVAQAANETARRMDQLKDAAGRDVLTGLRNRRGFLDAAAGALVSDRPSVIALIDLDHFKRVNDDHGHDRGDQLLTAFSDHLASALRRSDISARWGGEEFVVLFPDTTPRQAREILLRLQSAMEAAAVFSLDGGSLTFSCGLAPVTAYEDLAEATRDADHLLYAAKDAGRNQISSVA